MTTFIDAWLLEAPMGLSQELAGTVKLVSAGARTEIKNALCLQVELQGGFCGSFWVIADAEELARLFVAARITPNEVDDQRDAGLWRGIVQQVAERAASVATRDSGITTSIVAVRQARPSSEITSSAYEMRFGDTSVLVTFSDETTHAAVGK